MSEKRKPAIRQRPIQVKFFVDEKELAAIKQRMMESGTDNLSAYLRTMAMEGTFPTADGKKISKQKNCKNRDCLITIFTRNSANGAQPISLKLLKGLGCCPTSFCTSGYRRALLARMASSGVGTHRICLLFCKEIPVVPRRFSQV